MARGFDMNIGSVVDVQIDGEYNTCIVLSGKTYYDLYPMWRCTSQYLEEYHPYDRRVGLFVVTNQNYCPQILYYCGQECPPICYELLYGDNRVWIRDDILEKYSCRKI